MLDETPTGELDPEQQVLLLGRIDVLAVLRTSIDRRAPQIVERFFTRSLTVPDRQMRSYALVARLRRFDAHLCFALLDGLIQRAVRRNPGAQEVLLDLTTARPLVDAIGYRKTRRIYELAAHRGRLDLARMLLSPESPAVREVGSAFLARQNNKMPDESLGWRKALARGTNRLKIDRLLFDRNPSVVALLLDNPRLIERDVIRIAAMRPTNPANLVEVFRHSRWVKRYRVKVALACNPYTPIDIALSCVPHMLLQHLEYIASNNKIHSNVRDAAAGLLRARRQPPLEPDTPVHRVSERGTIVREVEGGDASLDVDLDGLASLLEGWMAD